MFSDFYGLSGRAFQLTPDPAFYFESLTHRKALSYLSYGLAQGEGFVVITGEVGAGKSTLVAHLMATIDPARLTAAQIVTSKLDGEELVHVVAQAFGLIVEGHDKASALGAIEAFLHDEARAGRRCLLVVDESQNLELDALEELRMLSNFQLGAHPLLQTLLLGQPEFRDTIQEHPQLEQLRQRVIAAHHLDAMEQSEVQPYVEHRLKKVGWQGNPSFAAEVFGEIYEASGGVPRRINQICNRLMLLGAVEQRENIDAEMLGRVLAELDEDGTMQLAKPERMVEEAAAAAAAEAAGDQAGEVKNFSLEQVLSLLAERDAQIAELQNAVIELANEREGVPAEAAAVLPTDSLTDIEARLAALEARSAQPVATSDPAATADIEGRLAALEAAPANAAPVTDFEARFSALEAKMIEQERTIRHTLAMLIEWVEADDASRAAA